MLQFNPNKGHSALYVADHIARIEGRHIGNQRLISDSMWRIASHCDLPELNNQLTPEQTKEVERFITDFKVNHYRLVERYKGRDVRFS
ncbi:MAG TPA: hypothetical protein V6D26_09930 [Stenomitos sp.]